MGLDGQRRLLAFKTLLGAAERRGRVLLGEANRARDLDETQREAHAWAEETQQLIQRAAGEGEASFLMSNVGVELPSGVAPGRQIRIFIDGRLRRIGDLIQRADTLPLEPDFDPDEFGDGGE